MPSNVSVSGTASSKFRIYVLILLPLLSALGAYGTYVLGSKNGLFSSIDSVLKAKPQAFPGTTDSIVSEYTGIGSIDRTLRTLVIFFAPVVDSANGDLNVFSIFGLGQFGAAWVLLMLESLRTGNKGRLVSLVVVLGLFVQTVTFTVSLPLYLFIHLLTSPVGKSFSGSQSTSAIVAPTLDMTLISLSVAYGYVVPTLFMALPPSVVSSTVHQWAIAIWQFFPLWTYVVFWILRSSLRQISDTTIKTPSKSVGDDYLTAAQGVYGFAICLSAITHIPAVLATFVPASVLPASTPPFVVNFFQSSFSDVYIPYYPDLNQKMPDLAAGVLNFLQWDIYIGSTAFLIWGMLLCRDSVGGTVHWGKAGWTILSWTIVSGPMGALAMLLWERDTIVKEKVKDGE